MMDVQKEKCVIILDSSLPPGLLANTAAILGITIGQKRPDIVGTDVFDTSGRNHPGIITFPVPILKAEAAEIRNIREKLYDPAFDGLTAVDFSDLAQSCLTYSDYVEQIAAVPESALRYLGLAVCGEKRKINKLTGSLPLLR